MTAANDTRLVSRLSADQLRSLARQLRDKTGGGGADRLVRQPHAGGRFPLSFAQERLWFLDQLEPGLISYNVAVKVRFRGRLDRGALRESLSRIAGRHEALRTSFRVMDGKPRQEVREAAPVAVPLVDLCGLPPARRGAEADALALSAARTPFDLSAGAAGPLLRATLLRMAREEHRLVLVLHHVVCDGWSAGVLVREFALLYASLAAGGEAALPDLPVQLVDYAEWQRQQSASGAWKESLAYWQDQLAGLPPLALPTDRPRRLLPGWDGARERLDLQPGSTEAVREIGRRGQATPFMVLWSVFSVLLARAAGQDDFGIATPVAGRSRPELQGLIGFFADTLVLRTALGDDPSFGDVLARTRETVSAAFAHQSVPFALLVQELAPDRALGTTPLAQVMFSLEDLPAIPPFAGLTVDLEEIDNRTAKFDLLLALRFGAEGLQGHLEYPTDLFEPATAARLAAQLAQLLAAVGRDAAAPVFDLPLLSAAERHQVVTEWNAVATGPAAGTIPELLSAQAARTPGATAVIQGAERLTYGELHARAGRLAQALRQRGVGPEIRVGVCLERSADLVAALIAVLQAGGAYVPLDPAYPRERLAYILADSGAALVVTREELLARLPADGAPALCLDRAWGDFGTVEETAATPAGGPVALPQSLAYVIYTSGSTGRPKGVGIEHRHAAALLTWARGAFADAEIAGVLAATSVCFDLSVFELFVPLAWGGSVILADTVLDLPALPAAAQVTLVNSVPSAVAELVRGGLPPGVRTVNLAGEALPRPLVDELFAQPSVRRVLNLYGPSEDTTYSTLAAMRREDALPPAIGRPVADTRASVVDAALRPLPIGVPGELALASRSLARGYLGRPELTAERFVPDPLSGVPGERTYRTGDLARWRPDGELEFLGRTDHQVKVRGYRIEMGEIEAALRDVPGVEEAVVAVFETAAGDRRLAGFYVARQGGLAPADLLARLQARLPAHMVPASLVQLAALPRTANGKIDRQALPKPEWGSASAGAAPRTLVEQVLAAIWCDVLGVERVGREDRFFDLGGHSLLATQVVSRVRGALGIELPVRAVFEARDLAALAARIAADLALAGGEPPELALPPLVPQPRPEVVPLSFAQQRLWLLDQLTPGSAAYNIPYAVRAAGRLHVPALARAFAEIVRRHESLRTTFFAAADAEPAQRISPPAPVPLPVVDLRGLGEAGAVAAELAAAEARRPFDLARGPLLRVRLLRLAAEEHLLLLTLHHIVSDGWSLGVLVGEVAALYEAFVQGRPSPLADLPVQYADFALWQRHWLAGGVFERQLAFWRSRLTGVPALDLPADRPRTGAAEPRGGARAVALPADLALAVQAQSRSLGATPFMVLFTAFAALLSRLSGREDLSVAVPVAGRRALETEPLIGFFVNTLVLRTDLSGEPAFRDAVGRVRRVVLEADAHQDLPFERLVEELQPARSLRLPPLAQAMFAFQHLPQTVLSLPDLTLAGREVETEAAKFDLSLSLFESPAGIAGRLGYDAGLFLPATAARLLRQYEVLLTAALTDPERRLANLPLLREAERFQLLVEWNETGEALPAGEPEPVQHRFAARAASTPDAPAVVFEERSLTYAELNRRANQLAHFLLRCGIEPEAPVALLLERSEQVVVGLLGALKAGAPYVPLDPALPGERLGAMLADSGARAVISTAGLVPRLPLHGHGSGVRRIHLDTDAGPIAAESAEEPSVAVTGESLAYVIFTSGSTGRPKGVAVEHRQLAAYVQGVVARFGLAECTSFGLVSTFAADLGHTVLFPALVTGGCLHVIAQGTAADADAFAGYCERHPIDCLKIVPSHLAALLTGSRPGRALPRRRLILGGEASTWDEVDRIRSLAPGCQVCNHYGPTETTVGAVAFAVPEGGAERFSSRLPLGRPLPGARAYLLDAHLQPVPVGVPGELWIGGAGVARGYIGRPDLTAERFFPDAWDGAPGARVYRTGDLVRRLPGGDLEFLGRIDHQVKIRGFRVEPLEVAAVLERHPAVREALVLALDDGAGAPRLVAYVVTAEAVGAEALRAHLAASLPDYMIPAAFVALDALPLTANGKVDRAALPQPALVAPEGPEGKDAAPRTPTEELLAGLWAEVLGRGRVGTRDDFFALGGHSLLATRLVARARQAFGLDLPLRSLFETPTIAGLAARIDDLRRGGERPLPPPIIRRTGGGEAPLSFSQERLWFLDQLEPGSAVYNLPYFARVRGPLSPAALAGALVAVAQRHESLRTRFPAAAGRPVQQTAPEPCIPLPLVDLAALPPAAREAELACLLTAEARRPWDLANGPLVRARLVRLDGAEHVFALAMHHIVSDAWSRGVLTREVAALYAALAQGGPSPLAALPLQYSDFARWQRDWLRGETLEAEIAWWRDRLDGIPPLQLPLDRPRPKARSGRGGALPVPLPAGFRERVEGLARRLGATPFMVLLSVYAAQLHRYIGSGGDGGMVVGAPIANRHRTEIEGLIGCFVNTLALPVRCGGELAFEGLVAQVRETALGAYDHQDLPFEKLVEAVAGGRDLHRPPLASVAFLQQSEPIARLDFSGLTWEPLELHSGTAKLDLTLAFAGAEGDLRAVLEYDRDLFDTATAARMAGHFGRLAAAALESPGAPLPALPLLTAAEIAELEAWNRTGREYPEGFCLHQLFEAQVARTPEAEALVWGGERVTYRELDRRAGRVARELRRLGVGPEVRVGVLLGRTPELVAGLLGILKAGGAYVPLDPAYPAERLAWMAADAGIAAALVEAGADQATAIFPPRVHRLHLPLAPADGAGGDGPEACAAGPGNLAYLIYTSGSTGRPKAVAIEHRSAVVLAQWAREVFTADELAGVLGATSISFDLSVFELFVPLAWGGKVVLAENALALPTLPAAAEVRLVNTVPSAMTELVRLGAVPPGVRTVSLAGEPLPRPLADRLYAGGRVQRVLNLFGPSEDTTYSTWSLVAAGDGRPPAVGRPVAETQAWVLDAHLGRLPVGVPGELYLGGGGLARGYLGRPELTAERFVPDPFVAAPGARLYRTGDLCRLRADGELEYLGRLDHQVKVRGFRIEPGEVEEALLACPGVREAVVMAREDGSGTRSLVAWVAADAPGAPLVRSLRQLLGERLPAHMVPSVFIELPALPRTPNGKVDRRALPAPERDGAVDEAAGALRTPVEEVVAMLWAEVLGGPTPGSRESFFEIGGHSLLATQVVARVRAAFGVELPVRALFESPTVAGLAAVIERAQREEGGLAVPPIARSAAVPAGTAPLSFAQERLWFLDQLAPGDPAYNVAQAIRLEGDLDVPVLARSLAEVVRRHETLRSRFAVQDGGPVSVLAPASPFALPVVDLCGLPAAVREEAAGALARQEARRAFDLARGPLLRATLLRLGDGAFLALFGFHHIAGDGWSMGLLVREVGELYAAFRRGEASPLPDLPLRYADYAAWQRGWLQGEVLEREIAHWRDRLSGAPAVLELPADRPRGLARSSRGAALPFVLDAEESAELARRGRREGATLFMTLLAGLQTLLARYTGETRIPVGVPVAGRSQVETEGLIGLFVNTLVLCGNLDGMPTYRELIHRIRQEALEAWAHQHLPFEKLVGALQPDRNLGGTPLFQVLLVLQNAPLPELALPGLSLQPVEVAREWTKFDLSLLLAERHGEVVGWIEYGTDLFDAVRMERLAGHLRTLYRAAAVEADRPVRDLPLLTAAERWQLLGEWNATGAPVGAQRCLHAMFEEQVARTPGAEALVWGHERLSYADLDRRANRLASWLRRHGVGPEGRVAVLLERTADMVVTLLAVLKAGGAYVPLDPGYPQERLAMMSEDAGFAAVVTQAALTPRLPAAVAGLPVARVDADRAAIDREPGESPKPVAGPGNLAYVIFTSGSTGRPKGVAVEHRSAAAFVHWARGVFSAGELDGVLASTSISFDLSVFEIFVPLSWGGRILLAANALELPALPAAAEVRLVNTVPSAIAELLAADGLPAAVRTVNLAGEALLLPLMERLFAAGVERVYNLYGPSEDTTYSTFARMSPADRRAPAIGRPLAGSQAYLLDAGMQPAPLGVPGELFLGGAGLARGYLGRPDLTAARFVPDPFGPAAGGRLYRTGDLCVCRAGGDLEFLGRTDHQTKVRGFRIEPGEIEAVLLAQPGVHEAVVVAREHPAGGKQLVAYLAPIPAVAVDELRGALGRHLPPHMVPAAFVILPELPRTPNGKVDRRALPAPEHGSAARGFTPPRTAAEEIMAGLWSELLKVPAVGAEAGFFDLGGHSLLAARLVHRIRDVFGVALPLRSVFETPVLADLAVRVEALRWQGGEAPAGRLRRRTGEGPAPLTFAQERLWFLDRFDQGRAALNLPVALELRGPLQFPVLARSLSEVVRRHAVLRTVFVSSGGSGRQRIMAATPVPFPQVDLTALAPARRDAERSRLVAEEALRPFDLEQGPPLRAMLFALDGQAHVLALNLHHIVADGWSISILVREVSALYQAGASGLPSPLPELAVQYADFAEWQRSEQSAALYGRQLAYWRERLAGAPPSIELPTDRPRPAVQTYRGARSTLVLERELADGLAALGRARHATLFMTLLAAWKVLLYRFSGQTDLVIGAPFAGRGSAELETLIGIFLNSLALRTDLSGNPAFGELLESVRETALGAYAHEDVPFEKVLAELRPERDLSRTPVFQVFFNLLSFEVAEIRLPGLEVRPLATPELPSKFDLTVYAAERPEGILLTLVYNADLFDGARMAEALRQYRLLLRRVAADPRARIDEISLLSPDAAAMLPDPRVPLDDAWLGPVHQIFARRAAAAPDRTAILDPRGAVSYGELDRRSNRLARSLCAGGIRVGDVVAVYGHRSAPIVWAILGILKAGAAFVILDPAYPAQRLIELVEVAQPRAWLEMDAAGALAPGLAEHVAARPWCRRLRLTFEPDPAAEWEHVSAQPVAVEVGPDDVAYIAFTSGSTGIPKGVQGRHGPLSHFIPWQQSRFGLDASDRFSMLSGIAHDPLQRDIFTPLQIGATIVIPDPAEIMVSGRLAEWLQREEVTVAHLTPAMGQVIAQARPGTVLPALRHAFLVGDVLTRRDAARLQRLAPRLTCVNFFGSTETQRAVGFYVIPDVPAADAAGEASQEVLPLGRGMQDVQLLVLSAGDQLAGISEVGEVCVRSPHLARGYLGDPELTARKFVLNPFTGAPGDRLYRTGDLGRYLADGNVGFLGRADQQVKIRGFRIELGEIQAILGRHPGVREAVVMPWQDGAAEKRLAAYVVPNDGMTLDTGELRRFLQDRLAAYMVPSVFLVLERLPLTPNGKLDRRSLPDPRTARRGEQEYVQPRTRLEITIAEIWREVLQVDKVSAFDNFFDLGGHSLSLLQAHSELRERLGREIAVVDLFRYPTVSALARALTQEPPAPDDGRRDGRDRAARKWQAIEERRKVARMRKETGRG
ncbi:MAG: non-ribosomal peptide synthase/polyketide synthase [Acidobacteria bacterium]|nr:non-ribosomal peptide synthase/polyketide synthase [Acidobacteriota bacterium]